MKITTKHTEHRANGASQHYVYSIRTHCWTKCSAKEKSETKIERAEIQEEEIEEDKEMPLMKMMYKKREIYLHIYVYTYIGCGIDTCKRMTD